MMKLTVARLFEYRLNTFVKDVLLSKSSPLGEIKDYAIRTEFQARGSPHAHCLLWVKDAPEYGVCTNEEVCAFIDHYVSCAISAESESKLKELVLLLQKHKHSNYCKRNGYFRFLYPKPTSDRILIAEQYTDKEEYDNARDVLRKVRNALLECANDATLDNVVTLAEIGKDEYINALTLTTFCSR